MKAITPINVASANPPMFTTDKTIPFSADSCKDLNKKYPFIKLKQKNAYLRAVKEILAGDTVKDDTSIKKKGGEKIETFKQSFSVKFTDI